ncbi:MAG: DUF2007 domain-containing protein [Dehalococcoidia bacterium]|nr:DUF2007 domain-containing protein [Dehalococcoidia bacterium]
MNKEEHLVKIATAANEPLAHMWAEDLENQGIPCLAKPVGGPGITGVWAAAVFEHELWVRASQAAEAVNILSEYEGAQGDLTIEYQRETEAEER